ncbi:sugar transferase [Sphingobium yanoikuyae]|uniref:sugar transferase n=1 Tax=Sphingobium yanoikuyae TaxID=13690 RepID=UPI00345E7899
MQLILALVGTDILALLMACIVAAILSQAQLGSHSPGPMLALAILPLYGLSGFVFRAFSGEALIARLASVRAAIFSVAGATALLVMVMYAVGTTEHLSPFQLASSAALATLFLIMSRLCLTRYAAHLLDGELYSAIHINEVDGPPTIAGGLPLANPEALSPDEYQMLARFIGRADRVVVRCLPERRADWAHMLQGMNVHAEVIASEFAGSPVLAVGAYKADPTLVIARGPLDLTDRIIKRLFDIGFSVAAIIALLPLFSLIALAVKLSSPGPVLFLQPRIGRQNRVFNIYKFRSMRALSGDLDGARSASRDDDRITSVGRLLRRTSLDELPQLFNVLLGDMSIVGPRPHALYSRARNKLFWEVDQRYWHRHACKPGITGLAQVRGHRGATHREQDLTDRLFSDLEYLNKWSIWLDLGILLRTTAVLVHRNAF